MATVAVILAGAVAGWAVDLLLSNAYRSAPLLGAPSRCADCRAAARGVELLPLIGGFVRPRCQTCRSRLWPRFVFLTAGGAASFAACYLEFDNVAQALIGGAFCLAFLALVATDLEQRLLPDRIVLTGVLLAVGTAWLLPGMTITDVLLGGAIAIGVAAGLLIVSLPFGSGALGMGDLKVMVLMGVLLGPRPLIVAVFIATLSAGLVAAVLLLARRRRFGDYMPHGPFLALAAIAGLLWGSEIWNWYSE